jgi:hypothetical protein
VVEARPLLPSLPAGAAPADSDVPPPGSRGGLGRARQEMYKVLSESVPADGHGNGYGHGNGHGEPDHAAVPAGTQPDDAAIEEQQGDGQA